MPRRARLTRYMTVRELLGLLGLPASRLERDRQRKYLEARERSTGTKFLHRLSDSPNSPVFFTLADLRRYAPELFDRREEALEIIREEVHALQQQILELKQRDKALASAIRDVRFGRRSST